MPSHLREIGLITLTTLLLAVGALAAGEADDVGEGYRKRLDQAKQKAGELAKKVESDVVKKNKEAIDGLMDMTMQASGVAAEMSSIPPTPGDTTAAARNSPIKTHAQTSQQSWKSLVQKARQTHQLASNALSEVKSSDEYEEVEKELKAVRKLVDRDAENLKCGGAILTNKGDLQPHADAAMAGKQSACAELHNDEADLHQQEDRWKDFKEALDSGAVKNHDDRTGKVIDQADQDVDAAGSAIGSADASTGTGFQAAGGQSSKCAALSDPDAGMMNAEQSVQKTAYFK